MKRLLYIDVDGVLMAVIDGEWQRRPDVLQFLEWALERFDCRWLTSWGAPFIRSRLLADRPDLADQIPWTMWSTSKARAIELQQDFFIDVSPYGAGELALVQAELERRLGLMEDTNGTA